MITIQKILRRTLELPISTLMMAHTSRSNTTVPTILMAVGITELPSQERRTLTKLRLHTNHRRPRTNRMIRITTINPSPPVGAYPQLRL